MNLAKRLIGNAEKYGESHAFIFRGQPVSFIQLKRSSLKLANSLKNLGVQKGDKVAVYLPNCPQYIYAYAALWSIGATIVPLDYMLTEEELASCLSHSGTKLLVTKQKTQLSLDSLKARCPDLKDIALCDQEAGKFLSFDKLIGNGAEEELPADIKDEDYACIFYTSGTTGRPKGVLINYRQVGAPHLAMRHFVGLCDQDTALCALPLSHLGGLVFLQSMIFLGSKMILMERFNPVEFLKNIQEQKVNCFWLVPPMYYAILQLKEFEKFDLSGLKWIVVFGAPSSPDQLRRFHKYCPGADFVNGWGMTETQGPAIVIPRGSTKIESIGLPAPWMEVKVFDESDKEVPQGEIGEIVIRSWVVTDGYYKDPEATTRVKRNGWFHTGDLGRVDRDGYFYIVGRKREMIKVGGELVFEPEVEFAIHKHPDVAEVAVIGVADKLRGEVPKAIIAMKEGKSITDQEMRQFCKKQLAHFKIPRYFEFAPSLPKNRAGKIDKTSLRGELNR
ncbi:class I adenylate-forming enzyme family protein [Candidatus Omnitrophota bacterium]